MSELRFSVDDVLPEPYSTSPNLIAKVRIEESAADPVHALVLRAQVRIDAHRRPYSAEEERGLLDLFGPRYRWKDTLKPFLWMHATAMVQGFSGGTEIDLPLPCTYDFDVAGAKYLHALRDGTIPLEFLFSGTVFSRGSTGYSVTQVPWDREARYELPVRVWRALMDRYFPNSGWIRLDRDSLDALGRFKAERGLTTWEETVRTLVDAADDSLHEDAPQRTLRVSAGTPIGSERQR
jgi:Family of unknown function (DUF6084)